MIKIEETQVMGLGPAIRGMRNPMNSWDKSDSEYCAFIGGCERCYLHNDNTDECSKLNYAMDHFVIGPNDHDLAMRLIKGGPVEAKFRRQIFVSVNITGPLLWWKEFDTYKIGTTANSCSTMHKIHAKEFVLGDFTHENLRPRSLNILMETINELNYWRDIFINGGTDDSSGSVKVFEPKDREAWRQMIDLLPTTYNQMRTITFNYEVLAGMYKSRKNHKLREWRDLCEWMLTLPYSEFITGKVSEDGKS